MKKILAKLIHNWRYREINNCLGINSWLTPKEAEALYDLSCNIKSLNPVIVEIGSWIGQSGIILAKGLHNKGKVYCIDTFKNVGSLKKQVLEQSLEAPEKESIQEAFNSNITKYQVGKRVSKIIGYSQNVVRKWNKKIDLLFIDADHNYQMVYRDFILWSRHIKPEGWIAFHDVELPSNRAKHYSGPGKMIEKHVINNKFYKLGKLIGSLYVIQKIK